MVFRRALIGAVVFFASVPAFADAPCFGAFTEGQELAKKSKLLAARARLAACVADTTCPAPPLLRDCQEALTSVDARIGSIVLSSDAPLGNVTVTVDGTAAALDGKAIELDPGTHHVELTIPNRAPVVRDVLVTEGEKLKRVSIELPVAPREKPVEIVRTSPPYAAWIFGGVALAAGIGFGVLAGTGQATYDECQSNGCSAGTMDGLRTERVVTWVIAGVGVAAAVTSIVLFATHGSHKNRAATGGFVWPLRF